ncbi:MAG TPA: hypothetical protein VFI70_05790 [Nitrososphaeraceae archaeon]|nr:hypothetical protein [Nitrososphaeraceae archaeon]
MSANGSSNKRNDEDKNKANNNDVDIVSSESPTLATRYAHRAATLVRSIEKNSYLIIGIVIALFVLSTLDMLGVHEILPFSLDPVITVFSAGSIIALFYMLRLTIKSKRVLENWADVFERNSIAAGINISMGSRTREEAVRAIAETVEEIGSQLREYISSRDNYNEFFDIAFGKDTATATTTTQFDIVIDKDNLKPTENSSSYQDLKTALQIYGSVIVKFVKGAIDANTILSYYSLLSRYISITKNSVSLALIIGDDATSDAHNLALHPKNKKIGYMIIIERPLLTP